MITESNRLNQIAAFYNQEAFGYDVGYSNEVCLAENERVRQILLPIITGKTLDVGCGSGFLKEIIDVPDYTGIEISPLMTSLAKEKFPDSNFIVGDMHDLPFENEKFDTVVSLFGPFSYSLTPTELIGELKRVLKPGGSIAVMPYSLRVGHNLEVGGYSTATEASIQKIFYTQHMMSELMASFKDVKTQGINYFLNVFKSFSEIMGYQSLVDTDLFTKMLEIETVYHDLIPSEFARHMIVTAKK